MIEFTELLLPMELDPTQSQDLEPGVRLTKDGDTKWSPPLQQQLDVMKDVAQTHAHGHDDHDDDDSCEVAPTATAIFSVAHLP